MNSKPDKEDRRCDDIAFLSEIIDNFIFWQEIFKTENKIFMQSTQHLNSSFDLEIYQDIFKN